MKKKIIITILSLIVSLSIIFSIITIAYAEKIRNFEAESQESEEYFADKSVPQLISDMKFFTSIEELNPDLFFALYDKITIDDVEYCSDIIKSSFYSNIAKIAILDICREKEIKLDQTVLSKLIEKKTIDSELRSYIIGYCSYQNNDYLAEIKKVALDSNDELNYYALFRLDAMEKTEAENIAKQIISEYNGEYSDRMRNALLIEADRISTSGDVKEKNNFADLCNKIANTPGNEDNQLSISLALSKIETTKSLEYILNLDNVADEYKIGQIKNNIDNIKNELNKPANEENCKLLDSVLQYYPLTELKDELSDFKNKNKTFFDENIELTESINNTISKN